MTNPGTRADRRSTLFSLALVLLLCLPALLIDLDRPAPSRIMENLSIWTSQETWMRVCAGDPHGWIVPSWNGQPRVNKPPMLVWVNLLAWSDLTPDTADLAQLVTRARLVGVLFAVLALISTFWAGHQIGGRRLAELGALMTGTGILFLRQARMATYDTHLLGWLTLTVAAGLWTMSLDSERRSRWRILAGLALAGGALGAATLTKGPLAAALGLGPLLTIALLTREDRARNLQRLAGILLVALLVALPWYLHVLRAVPGTAGLMATEYRAERGSFQPPWYYVGLVALVFPWSFTMLRSILRLCQNDLRPRGPAGAAWRWFLFVVVIMSIPEAKQQRYIVPALPALGLILAQTWLADAPVFRRRWLQRSEEMLKILHWGGLALAAAALALLPPLQDRLVDWHVLRQPVLVGLSPWPGVVVLPLTLGLIALGRRWQRADRRRAAGWASGGVMVLLTSAAWPGYVQVPSQQFAHHADVLLADQRIGSEPVFFLRRGPEKIDRSMSKEFLLYTRRIVPVLDVEAFTQKLASSGTFLVAARINGTNDIDWAAAGMQPVLIFRDGEKLPLQLYRRAAPVPPRD